MDRDVFVISHGLEYIGYTTNLEKAIDIAKRFLSDRNENIYEIRKRYDNGEVNYVLAFSNSIGVRIERVHAV